MVMAFGNMGICEQLQERSKCGLCVGSPVVFSARPVLFTGSSRVKMRRTSPAGLVSVLNQMEHGLGSGTRLLAAFQGQGPRSPLLILGAALRAHGPFPLSHLGHGQEGCVSPESKVECFCPVLAGNQELPPAHSHPQVQHQGCWQLLPSLHCS